MATLTVANSHDYSADLLRNITMIDFTNPLVAVPAIATFASAQLFTGHAFSVNLIIDGSAGRNEIVITGVTGSHSLALSNWTFTNWGADDLLTQLGTSGDDIFGPGIVRDAIFGGFGQDNFIAGQDGEKLIGDSLYGGSGNDAMSFEDLGQVFVSGGRGEDFIQLRGDSGTNLGLNINISDGGAGRDIGDGTRITSFERIDFQGAGGNDTVTGGASYDHIFGQGGDDVLNGGGGADNLRGGLGADVLTGGTGADIFNYDFSAPDPLPGGLKANRDTIADFLPGTDVIEFYLFEDVFTGDFGFIGDQAFGNHAREVRAYHTSTTTFVQVDLDGDGVQDFQIKLNGVHVLTAADFISSIEIP